MKQGYTDITVVLDRSGSMGSIKAAMEQGFNAFVREQAAQPGEATLTLVQFDFSEDNFGGVTHIDTVYSRRKISEVPNLELLPRGWTPLNDAVGVTITKVGAGYAEMPEDERPEKVVFIVVTDGYENRSREYTQAQVRALIEQQRNVYNWQFVFLGANMDAVAYAANYGVPAAASATYSPDAVGSINAFAAVSGGVGALRSGSAKTFSFNDHDRKLMNTEDQN